MDKKTSQIRHLADQIRDDRGLDYVDQRRDVKLNSPKTVKTIPELRVLITKLREMTQQLRQGISSFYERDLTRVVEVDELRKPSLKSISKGVDKLARALENSADQL